MEILSFPVGLLVGVIPVYVSLAPEESPARLFLDGREVCVLSTASPSCQIDLGGDLAMHRLELVGPEREGGPARVERWINRPGQEAELFLRIDKQPNALRVNVGWAHPEKLLPREVRLQIGGTERALKPGEPFVWQQPLREPSILVAEALFPDGRRAQRSVVLQADFAEEAESSLSPIVVEVEPGIEVPTELLGCRVVAVEEGDAVIGVVAHPAAVRALADEILAGSFAGSRRSQLLDSRIPFLRQVVAIGATPQLPQRETIAKPSSGKGKRAAGIVTLPANLPFEGRHEPRRFADAVALGAFRVGSWPGRRAVVLILDGQCVNDHSVFKAGTVTRYLEQLHIPLVIWSAGAVNCPQWPTPRDVSSSSRFDAALVELEHLLRRQRLLWLQGELPFPMTPSPWPRGIGPPKGTKSAARVRD